MKAPSPAASPIGQTLLAAALIGDDQLRIVLPEQRCEHRRVCVELGFITEAMLRDAPRPGPAPLSCARRAIVFAIILGD
jgi:hypothetical protein